MIETQLTHMPHMTLEEITEAVQGTYYGDECYLQQSVSNVVIDSRQVIEGSLFVAIPGERVDGHTFIKATMEQGALCALSEQLIEGATKPYILVKDSVKALQALARHYRASMDVKVIGITGSVGKTSTKEIIASVMSQSFQVLKTEGNFNNEIGLPLTIFNLRPEHQVAVLEMGISAFGEMEVLSRIAKPDICVFTNIGVAHIEHLLTRDGILKEKTDMMVHMPSDGCIVLNGDDERLATVTPFNGVHPTVYGLKHESDFWANEIKELGLEGVSATFHTPKSSFHATIPIPGLHMVYNALAAIAVAYACGMEDVAIQQGLETVQTIKGRNNLIKTELYAIIDDCYNANPASMKASLSVLAQVDGRRVAILGDMAELGDDWVAMHEEVGESAAELGIDLLICVGETATHIRSGAMNSANPHSMDILYYPSKETFILDYKNTIQEGDTILVKASNFMGFAEIVTVLSNEIKE